MKCRKEPLVARLVTIRNGVVAIAVLALVFTFVTVAATPRAAHAEGLQVVAQLHLLDLESTDQEDDYGSDEAYLTVNGQKVWETDNFDPRDIRLVDFRFNFDEVVTVEAWEDDGGLTGGDDHMGTWYMWAAETGQGVKTVQTQEQAGTWKLRYEVVTP